MDEILVATCLPFVNSRENSFEEGYLLSEADIAPFFEHISQIWKLENIERCPQIEGELPRHYYRAYSKTLQKQLGYIFEWKPIFKRS